MKRIHLISLIIALSLVVAFGAGILGRETGTATDLLFAKDVQAALNPDSVSGASPLSNYVVELEAESGNIISPMIVYSATSVSGNGYVSSISSNSGAVALTFSVPTAGYYFVWGRVKSPDYITDSFFVSADGGGEDIYDTAESLWSPQWQWTRVTGRRDNGGAPSRYNAKARVFFFNAGPHTLKFRTREFGAGLDKILITGNPQFIPGETGVPVFPPSNSVPAQSIPDIVTPVPPSGTVVAPSDTPTVGRLRIGDTVEVKIANLNVRTGPSLIGPVIRTVNPSQKGVVLDGPVEKDGHIWFKINYGNSLTGWSGEGYGSTIYLDKVSSGSVTPPANTTSPGGFELYLEAENAVVSLPALVVTEANARNGKYVFSPVANSGSVTFNFNAPVSGTYYIWSRVLAPVSSSDSFNVSVDNGSRDIYDTAERSWSGIWQWSKLNGRAGTGNPLTLNPRVFQLSAGLHKIEFITREANSIIDAIFITNNSSVAPSGVGATNTTVCPQIVSPAPGFCGNGGTITPRRDSSQCVIGYDCVSAQTTSRTLTVVRAGGGTVLSNPGGINCGSVCSYQFDNGANVTLTASPVSGYTFSGWSGACSGTYACSLSMIADKQVSLNFTANMQNRFDIGDRVVTTGAVNVRATAGGVITRVAPIGSVGSVIGGPIASGGNTWWNVNFEAGTGGWSAEAYLNLHTTVSAPIVNTLTVTKIGSGTVTSNPSGINCGSTCVYQFNSDTPVALQVAPSAGYDFVGWSGACSGMTNCSVGLTGNSAVTATFSQRIVNPPVAGTGASWYVSPNGSVSNSGSIGSPWGLQFALSGAQGRIAPGDTVYLRGGTYNGRFNSTLSGTVDHPIKVENYPGEYPVLDGRVNTTGEDETLEVLGSYVWFMGFEVTNTDPNEMRNIRNGASSRGAGVRTGAVKGNKFINLVVHDHVWGFSLFSASSDLEVYGNIIYNNGITVDSKEHGIYTQNEFGAKVYTDNIIFGSFSEYGMHAYGSSAAFLNNFTMDGNVLIQDKFLFGGGKPSRDSVVKNNFIYYTGEEGMRVGGVGGSVNVSVQNNIVYGASVFGAPATGLEVTGNKFYGSVGGISTSQYPNNTYAPSGGSGVEIFVRPNAYEQGRGNVVIYNWARQSSVAVDLSKVGLKSGDTYQVRNVMNYTNNSASVIAAGTYSGGSVNLPMTGLSAAKPLGNLSSVPSHLANPSFTGPVFAAFVVTKMPGGTVVPPVDLPAPVTYSLTVNKTGNGSITSAPSGISCGPICAHEFNNDASVTLTAVPASGYTFKGWSGACNGTGICVVALSPSTSVTAIFSDTSASSGNLPAVLPAAGINWYVSPSGSASGAGTAGSPWSLQYAFDGAGGRIQPGHTVWLRGGTYNSRFNSNLSGTASQPIIFRNFSNERATLKGPGSNRGNVVDFKGTYVWLWGVEITSAVLDRYPTSFYDGNASWPIDLATDDGVNLVGAGNKLINVVIHDTSQGVNNRGDGGTEIYGSLIYHNGWYSNDRGHGHGIYLQNNPGVQKKVRDNILFGGFQYGIHGYTENGNLDDILVSGNTVFNMGLLQINARPAGNILVGVDSNTTNNRIIRNNYLYYSHNEGITLDYKAQGNAGGDVVSGNYLIGGRSSGVPLGNYTVAPLTPIIIPNEYEPGRANIIVYNASGAATVDVNLSGSGLSSGDAYEIRDAQNYYGGPVVSGIYSGSPVTLRMVGLSAVQALEGNADLPNSYTHSAPRFGVFILQKLSGI
ncbi:MAG: hypothetical protein A3G59_00690 [Candidatus Taylorbacteria bacterium RIFCSPLOWO2_12_FULL_47_20]|uniref:SH3b domain-containing protein n=2 Tax=Candidatus Tayloriibacteriota TaxID=1817919 RepID=A0A1G2P754_9BACT|nr:MAG: hypothetical protein A3H68_01195 [Candidatus Taylorbacteria bacterium RIFCSPLOWO2_02_FULL_46_40]OHA44157.1 MAG: hypothetical protein A3G59_00690 [Candidatus Taylorbacteria bacterium RIFCSPLOWO2_12_FULL_47_20]